MPAWPRVGIVILNWNGLDDTLECLESLSHVAYPNYEVFVVDNGSSDGSPDAIRRRYPEIAVIRNPKNLGFSGGNNVGIRAAFEKDAEFVWLLNNDAIVEPDTLAHIVGTAMESNDIGLVSPVIRYYDERDQVQFCGSFIDTDRCRIIKVDPGGATTCEGKPVALWGTALLVKRTLVERIGFLEEKYFAYHEDEEFSLRAARSGVRALVDSGANVFHKNSRSTGSNDAPMQVFLRSRNMFFLWMDNLEGVRRIAYFSRYLAHIISYGSSLKERNLADSVEACLDGVWHAFRGMGGPRITEVKMPSCFRRLFHFLFSWHPFLWSSLLSGNFAAIGSNIRKRFRRHAAPV